MQTKTITVHSVCTQGGDSDEHKYVKKILSVSEGIGGGCVRVKPLKNLQGE